MRALFLESPLNDKAMTSIAACVEKIEKLELDAYDVTIHGWRILSSAINKRPIPVCGKKNISLVDRICFCMTLRNIINCGVFVRFDIACKVIAKKSE